MKNIKILALFVIVVNFISCQSKEEKFPIGKRYWTAMDYANVIRQIKLDYTIEETLPTYSNPETRIILEKLTDEQNYLVVLDDNELGLKHKNKVATDFFRRMREMDDIYYLRDRQDNFTYEKELIAVSNFGLGLQLKYFQIGNDEILESADDPNSFQIKNLVSTNINKLIGNFTNHLDEINNEKSYTKDAIESYCNGIDLYFSKLIEFYPDGYYNGMEKKVILMKRKTESDRVKKTLDKLLELIESKKKVDSY